VVFSTFRLSLSFSPLTSRAAPYCSVCNCESTPPVLKELTALFKRPTNSLLPLPVVSPLLPVLLIRAISWLSIVCPSRLAISRALSLLI